jgi:hypothetical protein
VAVVCGQRSPSEPSNGPEVRLELVVVKLALEGGERPAESASDPASQQGAVECSRNATSGLVLHDEAVDEPVADLLEVTFV